MPQATNIIVKNAAGVDKTFELISPAAGDGGVALWQLKQGDIKSAFPSFTAKSTKSRNSIRFLETKLIYPSSYKDTNTGLTSIGVSEMGSIRITVPDDMPESSKDDFVAYFTGLLASELVKKLIRDAVSAT